MCVYVQVCRKLCCRHSFKTIHVSTNQKALNNNNKNTVEGAHWDWIDG